ncbi:MAG: response regulator [Caldilineae bacterium]|nr:MAG: response regulator [Caldilineae bacterium]
MKKILIVDDQDKIRELVHVTIRIGDYEILEAASGDEAVEVARRHQPDLIFLDVMMPNSSLDGFEVCKILKEDERTKNAHILMLTALDKEEDIERGKEVGADGYFTKPFSPLELMSKVEEILG